MITDKQVEAALTFMKETASEYAQAKADRRYLEEFRKTLKARLYQDAPDGTVADKENWAYGHDDYLTNLVGIKHATEKETQIYWQLEAAKIQVEIWRTQQASARAMDRSAQ